MGLLVTILRIFGLYPTQKKRTGKAQTWREAASSGNGRIIYDGLKKEMAGPAGKTISRLLLESCRRTPSTRELPEQVIRYIHRESIKGRRAKGIAASLERRLPGIPKGQLESIVGTVIGKAETARERADCQKLGLDWYSWRTSCDARVRESHRIMEGVLVAWADPPAFGHAGEEDGCRCYPEPVLSIDSLTWPARVYRNGLIQNMTKAQFKRLQKQ